MSVNANYKVRATKKAYIQKQNIIAVCDFTKASSE